MKEIKLKGKTLNKIHKIPNVFQKNMAFLVDRHLKEFNKEYIARNYFDCSQSKLSKVINGFQGLSIEQLSTLHSKYQINLNWLICDKGNMLTISNETDPEPFICHVLFQQNQAQLVEIIARFFNYIDEALSFQVQQLLLPTEIGIADILARKKVNESSCLLCVVSNGHSSATDKWKELSIAESGHRVNEFNVKKVLYGLTASGEQELSEKNPSLLKAQDENRLFHLSDKKNALKMIETILNIREERKGKKYEQREKPFFLEYLEKTGSRIQDCARRRNIFLAGSFPSHFELSDHPENGFINKLHWGSSKKGSKNEFENKLKDFIISLCDKLTKSNKFILSSSALVKCVGEEVVNFCEQKKVEFSVEGMYARYKGDYVHESPYLTIERNARKNYLSNKEALVVVGGNVGTEQDIISAQELNRDAIKEMRPEIKIICIPCFGGTAKLKFLETSENQGNYLCKKCIKECQKPPLKECIENIYNMLG